MQVRGVSSEAFRVSVSSAPSSSSQGSGQDDCDALGDVYVWGEGIWDGFLGGGTDKVVSASGAKTDALLPKLLDSAAVLDVHHIACGVRHAALVTRQGEVFTWGEESGGRLGHGVDLDVWQPQLVEALANNIVDFVACGEYHTCAVTMTGELYTWGDGNHKVGLLGHGNDVSHWIPKQISGPLDGIQVSFLACGPWHTALVSSTGQLFTFGDGTFGTLGHGDRKSVSYPREVESLKGLRTVTVACGVWHTAAVVEVIVGHSSASSCSSGKLFTWGDGDKGRLGHGDKERKLVPTCVPTLIDYNFQLLACGHSLTVGLTTTGQVFTMGSVVYGQLGNPQSDGKLPCLVEGKLTAETVEEIACGAYHVAVLTAKTEVYTWGKGSNGRLGHGDVEDRKTPTLVEALKDKHVKNIACGSNFTSAVCLHKWVSVADQSMCSGCRQSFGFTRKRHNCYNCGLAHCHSCSSKKALKAALAPNPSKPHRVCDSCYVKLKKASEAGMTSNNNKRNMLPRHPNDTKDRLEKPEAKASKQLWLPSLEAKSQTKRAKKCEPSSSNRGAQVPPLLQLKDIKFSNSLDPQQTMSKPFLTSLPQSRNNSRAVSPFSRRPSPPRSATPTPTMGGLASSKSAVSDLKKTNDVLNQEVLKLRNQVESLRQRCIHQEEELQRTAKQVQETISLAGEESAKCKAAKEVIKSLTAQVEQLRMRLQYERTMRHALEAAMGQASSSLSPGHRHYDAQIRELMMEITSLEEEVIDRERHVLSLYRNVFDQCIAGLQSLQNSNQASPTHVQNECVKHPCTVSRALYTPSKCLLPQHRRHVSTSTQCSQRASMHLLSKSRHSTLFSGRFSTDDQIQNLQPQTGSKVEQGCEEFSLTNQKNAIPFTLKDYIYESPNRLSEELVRCMAAIYCKLSDPPCAQSGMALSTSSSISSTTTLPSHDVLSDGWSPGWKAQSVCDTPLKNPFKIKGETVNAGPYRFMVEIPWICADNDQLTYATCMLRLFRSMVEHLEKVDPSQMQQDSKLAFWINVYNALVMHAYLAYGIPRNNLRRMPLFQRAAYKIGGYSISANTIEHSILCCRTYRPTQWLETLLSTKARFKAGEERRTFGQAFGLDDAEPLVFFALCGGGYSDPAVRVYTAKNVHDELETAKREFLQASIGIQNHRKVFLPKILERYAKEASVSPTNLLIWVSQNVDKQQQAAIKKCIEGKPHKKSAQCIEWLQYDASFRYIFARDLVAGLA